MTNCTNTTDTECLITSEIPDQFVLQSTVLIVIAVCGTVTNSVSLSYFVSYKAKDNRCELDKFLVLLNIFDLVICISSSLIRIVYHMTKVYPNLIFLLYLQNVLLDVFTGAVQCAGFVTCVLSATRLVGLWKPFHMIKMRLVRIALVLYVLFMVSSTVTFTIIVYMGDHTLGWKLTMIFDSTTLVLILILVMVFNTLTATLLMAKQQTSSSQADEDFRDAAVTVLIVSTLFCVFYSCYTYRTVRCLHSVLTLHPDYSTICDTPTFGAWFVQWVGLPLNSALNPAIYLARAENMRTYAGELCRRVRLCTGPVGRKKPSYVGLNTKTTTISSVRSSPTIRTSTTIRTTSTTMI